MRADLKTITEEMTGDKKLAEVLEFNFKALNEMAHDREMQIFNRLTTIKQELSQEISDFKKDTGIEFKRLNTKIDILLKHFKVDPGKDLLTDSEG